MKLKQPTIAPKTYLIEKTNLTHILPVLGQKLVSDLDASDISRYQHQRLKDKAAPMTIKLEVGTVPAQFFVGTASGRMWAGRTDAFGARRHRQGVKS